MLNSTKIFSLLVVAFLLTNVSIAQKTYPKVKVTLKSGVTFEGKKGNITDQSVSFMEGTALKTYDLSEVNFIQAKSGKAGKWALGCGAGCLGVCIVSGIVSGEQGIADAGGTVGTYVAGTILWTGIFAGVGALIGGLSDSYTNVYVNSGTSSIINRFNLGLSSNQVVNYNLTLSYKF
jgi:hypothetical protein